MMKRMIVFLMLLLAITMPLCAKEYTSRVGNNWLISGADLSNCTGLTGNTWIETLVRLPGSLFYVDSAATGAGTGLSWTDAKTTVDAAIALTAANNGDTIYVAPGHAETIAAADGWDADVAGITIIGVGYGEDMPEFNYTATASTVAIGAANVTVKNCRFVAGVSAIVIGIAVEAAGDNFTLEDCIFPEPTTSTFEFIDAIDLETTVNGLTVKNCEYSNYGATGSSHFIEAGNGTNHNMTIVGNRIIGEFLVAAIWSDTIDLDVYIYSNTIQNLTTGQHCIEFTTTATGWAGGNDLYGDTEGSILDSGSLKTSDNNISVLIDLDAIPLWVIDNGFNHFFALDGATQVYPENAVDDSVLAKLLSKSDPADISDYDMTTDSLEAIADRGIAILADTATLQSMGTQSISKAIATITNSNHGLFTIAGGPIVVEQIVTYVTVNVAAEGNLVNYNMAVTTPAGDVVFGTDGAALETNNAQAGTVLIWDGVIANDLTASVDGVALHNSGTAQLVLPPGVLELAAANDGSVAGTLTTYLTYRPLTTGVTVTAVP